MNTAITYCVNKCDYNDCYRHSNNIPEKGNIKIKFLKGTGYCPIHVALEHEKEWVTELCSECNIEVDMRWDVEKNGYKAYCPFCGKRLMICSECAPKFMCDYDERDDSCRFNKKGGAE